MKLLFGLFGAALMIAFLASFVVKVRERWSTTVGAGELIFTCGSIWTIVPTDGVPSAFQANTM